MWQMKRCMRHDVRRVFPRAHERRSRGSKICITHGVSPMAMTSSPKESPEKLNLLDEALKQLVVVKVLDRI